MTLVISVYSDVPQNIKLVVEDSDQRNTVLASRSQVVEGNYDFYVRMPLCRKFVTINLYNDDNGSSSFDYLGCQKTELVKRIDIIDMDDAYLQEAIVFFSRFCYHAGVLAINDPRNPRALYMSDGNPEDGQDGENGTPNYYIKYLPVIKDINEATGKMEELTTPSRISDTGLIEVSQKYFVDYSVPMRMAILLHEYSHVFVNQNPDSESEADMNSLVLYLGLGYPRSELGEAWYQTFSNYDTEENNQRMDDIVDFVENFESQDTVFW